MLASSARVIFLWDTPQWPHEAGGSEINSSQQLMLRLLSARLPVVLLGVWSLMISFCISQGWLLLYHYKRSVTWLQALVWPEQRAALGIACTDWNIDLKVCHAFRKRWSLILLWKQPRLCEWMLTFVVCAMNNMLRLLKINLYGTK